MQTQRGASAARQEDPEPQLLPPYYSDVVEVLEPLYRLGGSGTATDVAKASGLTPPTARRKLAKLAKYGLVRWERRKWRITQEGIEMLRRFSRL